MASMPEVKAFIIADTVLQEKQSNKWSVIGIFDRVAAAVYPTSRPAIGIYVKLADVRGRYKIAMEFRDTNDRMLNRIEGIEIGSPDKSLSLDFGLQTFNLPIPAPGKYHFLLYIDGALAQMVPMEAVKLQNAAPPDAGGNPRV